MKSAHKTQGLILHGLSPCENIRTFRGFDGVGRGLARTALTPAFVARFHTKYQRSAECWLWQAGKFPKGYGMVNVGRNASGAQFTTYAHRVAYVLAHGDIPAGRVVMHSCDTPACVNPAHLSLGTQGDNIRDGASRGRYSVPHFSARSLSDAAVAEIRQSRERGVVLAKLFGVSPAHISFVRRGYRRAA